MKQKQKIITIVISSLLVIIIILIVSTKPKKNKVIQENVPTEINKNESTELIKNFNKLREKIINNTELELVNDEIKTYKYNGDVQDFKKLLYSVYMNPFYKNEVFESITNEDKEEIKIHLPKTCNLMNVEENSKISKGNENESTIVIGEYEYVVVKGEDNNWKFIIPIPICE